MVPASLQFYSPIIYNVFAKIKEAIVDRKHCLNLKISFEQNKNEGHTLDSCRNAKSKLIFAFVFYIMVNMKQEASSMKGKTVAHSRAVMSQVMLPSQANPTGNVHGGEIMKLMDTTAYVVAARHARTSIVTARVDELLFHTPIFVGALVTCRAELGFVGRTSMEIHVRVEAEYLEQEKAPETALTALFTMVALDKNGVPCPVPPLILSTPEEQERFRKGEQRYKLRKSSRKQSGQVDMQPNNQ
jgi:acyl-CoA hydrolase